MLRTSASWIGVCVLVAMCPGASFGQAAIELIPRAVASPSDTASVLPAAQLQYRVGDPFVVEMWAQTLDVGGLGQASADISFDPTVVTAGSITITSLFNLLTSGTIDNIAGVLDNVSGSHFVSPCDGTGFAPNWARVAIITMSATGAGLMTLQSAAADPVNNIFTVTNCSGPPLPVTTFGSATISVLNSSVAIELVALSLSGVSDTALTLPTSDAQFARGSTFFVEMWAQATASTGLSQASADISFDPLRINAVSITQTPLFSLFPGGTIDNVGGLLNDVSGLHNIVSPPCSDAVGFQPQWARVAVIKMTAVGDGPFTMQAGATGNPTFGVAVCSSALTPIATYGSAGATIVFPDCNNNGIDDTTDIANLTSLDCNGNGRPDECDVLPGPLRVGVPINHPMVLGSDPRRVATGDFNGDGFIDIAVGTAVVNLSNLSVFFGNGDGTFGPVVETNHARDTLAMVAADMDADADLDLVMTTRFQGGNDAVTVFFNNGTGFFSNPLSVALGGLRALSLAVADVDGNGTPDVVTANRNSGDISVLLNNGTGTLGVATTFPAGVLPLWVALGDFDGDLDVDAAVANTSSDVITVLRNNGAGGFSLAFSVIVPGQSPIAVEAADLDFDGDVDLVVLASGASAAQMFLNGGVGNFTLSSTISVGQSTVALTVADMDGDLDIDVVVANDIGPLVGDPASVSVIANNGNGTFAPSINVPMGTLPVAVATGDFDGDGQPDVVVADSSLPGAVTNLNLTDPPVSQDVDRDGIPDECAVCGDGIVQGAEACDDGNVAAGDCCSPTCQFESTATVCRVAASDCDVAEFCDGAGTCTADALRPLGTSCGNIAASVCDDPDTCNGMGVCLPNAKPVTTVCRSAAGVCDVADFCDGAGLCAADAKSTAVCRAAVDGCDVAEVCDGVGNNCPVNSFALAGLACGDITNTVCDNPDTCDGAGVCLPNAEPATTECRPAAGVCDVADFCNGTGACSADAKSTAQCRASAGECDVPESCDGVSNNCPINGFRSAGAVCGDPASTVCDSPDSCDGGGTCLPNPKPVTTECRASVGVCDVADFCNGAGMCVPDAKSLAECRPATGACDIAESCNGVADNCPADLFITVGTACGDPADTVCDNPDTCDGGGACLTNFEVTAVVCRTAATDCDVPELCDGLGRCPLDDFKLVGTTCGSPADTVCDNPDTCDGGGVCLSNPEPVTTGCRASAGVCDLAEFCDGAGLCSPDAKATTECRAAVDACDVAEVCDGISNNCPANTFSVAGAACGDPTITACDRANTCDGSGGCLANPEPVTTECRAAAGVCDVADFCDGTGMCTADVKAMTECRAAVDACDVAEVCDGIGNDCPVDAFSSAGVACGDPTTSVCDNADSCDGSGTCQSNPAPTTTVCRPSAGACDVADSCDGAGQCAADAKATTECRAAVDACDVAEVCDGIGNDCPLNVFSLAGVACGDPTISVCDNADTCDGGGACLANPQPVTTECRAAAGVCDAADFCDGAGLCSVDAKATTECRAAVDACDVAEACDGVGNDCPVNAFSLPNVACGDPAVSVCDNADTCDGSGACLANPEPVTTECRAAGGVCDVADFCDGAGLCSADAKATIECRPALDVCDVAEVCDGIDNNCPADRFAIAGVACGDVTVTVCDDADSCDGFGMCIANNLPDGTSCSDAVFCNGGEACLAGVCATGPAVCTDVCETCSEAAGACTWCIFDHNLNSVMDGFDFAVFSGCFGSCFAPADPCFAANYDADPAGCVGGSDFGAFSGCFGQTCGQCVTCSGPPLAGSVAAGMPLSATTASIQLVAVGSSQVDDLSALLPLSRRAAALNETFDVEVWASLASDDLAGLGSVYIDVAYDPSRLAVVEVIPSASFATFSRGLVDAAVGLVSAVGGCAPLGDGALGVGPMWVRVATLRMRATGAGVATMTAGPSYGPYGVSVFGRFGDLSRGQVDFGDARLSLRGSSSPRIKRTERSRDGR